jgi:hypothetical protein
MEPGSIRGDVWKKKNTQQHLGPPGEFSVFARCISFLAYQSCLALIYGGGSYAFDKKANWISKRID